MRLNGQVVISALLFAVLLPGGFVAAQETDANEEADAPAVKIKRPWSLYVSVAAGTADADEIDSSIETTAASRAESILSLDDQSYGRAVVGWKFQNDKGDLQVIWNGFREEEYRLTGGGDQAFIDLAASGIASQPNVVTPVRWWTLDVANGVQTSTRSGPIWNAGLDVNGDNAAQPGEVTYDPMNAITVTSAVPDNLQNRLQSIDIVYGREFGTRRYSSRWFAGVRYYTLEGTVPAAAWMLGGDAIAGAGFTDGQSVNLLAFYNETTGIGPTVSMSFDVKFFGDKLRLFAQGQAALALTTIDSTSNPFQTFVVDTDGFLESADGQLTASRNKSTWSNQLDLGVMWQFANGVGFEVSYSIMGMLDAYLLPTNLRIPVSEIEINSGSSAIYNTQDYVLNTLRAGVSFQF